MKKIWILTALLALTLLTGCGKADELQAQLDELQSTLKTTEERLTAAEAGARDAMSELTEVRAQLDAAEKKLSDIGSMAGLVDGSIICTEPSYAAVFIPENTKVYQQPSENVPHANSIVMPIRAEVLAQGYLENGESSEEWILVKFPAWGAELSLGWVKLTATEEYTYANREEISWPLYVKEGAVVYEDKECEVPGEVLAEGEYLLEGIRPGHGVAQISAPDGWTAWVDIDDLIYPKP